MQDKILIGTFIKAPHVSQKTLKEVVENFVVNKIFIFSLDDESHKRLVTFNTLDEKINERIFEFKKQNKNTLMLHRRKDSNTFYTINSLKALVESQGGSFSQSYKLDWSKHKNCCLVLDRDGKVKSLRTKLAKIIEIEN